MSYPAITARRMPYDIDGTEVGYADHINTNSSFELLAANGIKSWLTSQEKGNLNKENREQTWGQDHGNGAALLFTFFFPEQREITHIGIERPYTSEQSFTLHIQGSNDSTNGIDGTWETAVFTWAIDNDLDAWRGNIVAVSFSGPVKVLRVGGDGCYSHVCGVHVYGQKAAGQTPDDIIFCDNAGTERTSLLDWGDEPEGTTDFETIYLKNVSTKTANGVNIQLNHADFLMSWDQVTWASVLDITSLNAGQVSAPIYVKLALGPPLLILGPRAARAIVTVTSWTA